MMEAILIRGTEIVLGVCFLTLGLWIVIQAWYAPLLFNVPILVVSEAALVGGPLWLWGILRE
jgi:hypothetical protein